MISRRTPTRPRLLLSAVAAIGVCVGLLSPGASASASTPLAVDEPEPEIELAVTLGTHGTAVPGADIAGVATVRNPLDDAVSTTSLEIGIDRSALADMAAVERWLSASDITAPDIAFTTTVATIATDADTDVPFTIPAGLVQALAPGVYPVRATLRDAADLAALDDTDDSADSSTDGTGEESDAPVDDGPGVPLEAAVSTRTVLTVADGSTPTVSILVPITATPAAGDLLSSDELTELTADDGALTEQLDAVVGTSAVLAVDPAILAAIRVLGTAAPESAQTWLTRLGALPNERFPLQFGDADLAVQARAELPVPLGPESLDIYQNTATVPEPSPSPTTTADGEPATPTLPDVAALTQLDGVSDSATDGPTDGMVWPRPDVTSAELAVFDDYVDGATTVLPSTAVEQQSGAHAVVDGHSVLVTDAEISTLASRAIDESLVERPATLAQMSAALHYAGAPASGLLVGLDRDETRRREALRDVIETVDALPLASIRRLPAAEASLKVSDDTGRAGTLRTLLADETHLTSFATILVEPAELLTPERIRILRLIGVGADPETFADATRAHRLGTERTLGSVGIQEYTGPIQLFSANVSLPVWVRNDLPWPVRLTLEVRPSDPRIDVETYTPVEAVAASNTKVQVPVAARIASGELRVGFSLAGPTGVPIGAPQTASVTVRAEWEGIGLSVLAGIIVLLLGFGILRTVRRRRRETKDAATDASIQEDDASVKEDE